MRRPYVTLGGSEVRLTLRICLTTQVDVTSKPAASAVQRGTIPGILLAHEDGLTVLAGTAAPRGAGLLARTSGWTDIAGLT